MATKLRKLPKGPPLRRHADFQDFVEDVANAASAANSPRGWRLLFDKVEHLAERCKAHMKAEEADGIFEAIERAAIVFLNYFHENYSQNSRARKDFKTPFKSSN